MQNTNRSLWLDFVRGICALIVCSGHVRNAILVDFTSLKHPSYIIKAFYFITSLGHEAVMVFFVLSGYFVGGGVLRSFTNFSWARYMNARLSRQWVVLLPCLAITLGIDAILKLYYPKVLLGETYALWHSGPVSGLYSVSFNTLISNIFFMQTIISPVFGTNGPLWSLANEFWYYMLFPIILIAFSKSTNPVSRVFAISLSLLILWALPKGILLGFAIWCLGVVVYLFQSKFKSLPNKVTLPFLLFGLLLFGLSLAYSKSKSLISQVGIESDLMVGISFALVCLALTARTFPKSQWPWLAYISRELSEMSYSLYLSHFPLVVLFASVFYLDGKFLPSMPTITLVVLWCLALVIVARLVWWAFESRTDAVRSHVARLMKIDLKRVSAT